MLSAVARLFVQNLPRLIPGRVVLWDTAEEALWRELCRGGREPLVVEDRLEELTGGEADTVHAAFPPPDDYGALLIAMSRDRERSRQQLAWAARHLAPGGSVLFAGANKEGIKAYKDTLKTCFAEVEAEMHSHCRVWLGRKPRDLDELDTDPQPAYELPGLGTIYSLPGVFGHRGLDEGTAALLEYLPDRWRDWLVCDLGCGAGPLALKALCGEALRVDALDSSAAALRSARATLAPFDNARVLPWRLGDAPPDTYDAVICNPPFHVGGRHAVSLSRSFVEAAAGMLVDDGELWLVLRRELPADRILAGPFKSTDNLDDGEGHLLIRAVKGEPADGEGGGDGESVEEPL